MLYDPPRLIAAGDSALLIEFGDAIDPAAHDRVRGAARAIEAARPPAVIEHVPTFRSLMVYYDPLLVSFEELRNTLEKTVRTAETSPEADPAPLVEVPVVYGGEWGPDLATVVAQAGVSEEEAIALHAGTIYRVYMLGFSPGFPYMGEVPAVIATPRLASPRPRVPAGSVGIAGSQTGIYPLESPGGWQLIGRTPLATYAPWREWPFRFRAGDRVRFRPIPPADFDRIYREEHPCEST